LKPPLQCGKKEKANRPQPQPPHTRYLSSPPAATLHGKTHGFVLRLPPQNKAHATFMQPSQCVLQHDVANWQTHMYLRTWQQSMTAIMQPLQCDLQPQIQETHKTTHTGATTRCRTQRRNQFRGKPACLDTHVATKRDNNHVAIPLRSATTDSKTPYNYARTSTPTAKPLLQRGKKKAAHWRYVSSPTAATLHGKTQGFMLRLPPQHKADVTFLQPSQCVLQHDVANPHVSTHMATKRGNNHVAIPLRSATTDSKTPFDYARTSTPKAA